MAEKTDELTTFNEPDAVSTTAGANQDTYLEAGSDNYPLNSSEALEIEVNTRGGAPEETEHLKAQIEETRVQMGETIGAIQEKLSIKNISEQVKEQVSEEINNALETAKETVYGATIGNLGKAGKFMQNVGKELSKTEAGKFARKNPFPLVLIGLGVGLLAYELSGKKRRSGNGSDHYEDYNGESGKFRGGRISSSINTLKSATGKIGGTANSAYESVSHAAGNALHSVSDAASSAYENVANTASSAYSSVSDLAGNAYEKAGEYGTQAREQYDYYIEENPLAVGAVALAVGAAVGLAIPATRYESDLMGEYSRQVLDKAQTAVVNLVEKAKETASDAQKTIGDEVKASVGETRKTIANEAKNQGLTH